jgi:hypothetical protein
VETAILAFVTDEADSPLIRCHCLLQRTRVASSPLHIFPALEKSLLWFEVLTKIHNPHYEVLKVWKLNQTAIWRWDVWKVKKVQ